MKRLQIVDHNINIGHCKVYSMDFVTNILWFIKRLNSEFCISEFRILNSEFRIPNFEKKLWMVIWLFEDVTLGSVDGVGQGIQN